MKKIFATTITLLAIAILINLKTSSAGERVPVFEMAESGITIEFPLAPEQIAAKEPQKTRLAKVKEGNEISSQGSFRRLEMGESGQTVSFAMSAEEIAAEDAELARLAAIRVAKSRKMQIRVIRFELGESGLAIELPVETSETAVAVGNLSEDSSITNLNHILRIADFSVHCNASNYC